MQGQSFSGSQGLGSLLREINHAEKGGLGGISGLKKQISCLVPNTNDKKDDDSVKGFISRMNKPADDAVRVKLEKFFEPLATQDDELNQESKNPANLKSIKPLPELCRNLKIEPLLGGFSENQHPSELNKAAMTPEIAIGHQNRLLVPVST